MMNYNERIVDITSKLVAELGNNKPTNLLMAVRTHYDLWQDELIFLLKERNIPIHQYIATLLKECGYENATADKVRSYMNTVKKSKQARVPNVVVEKSTSQPPSIVHSQNNKEGLAPSHQLKTEPVPMAITKPQVVAKPVQVASKQYNLDEFPFVEHTERLQVDVLAGYEGKAVEWNALDDELLDVFSQISKNKYTPLEKLNNAFTSIEDIKKNCYAKFKLKCKACGIELKNYGFKN